MFLAILKMTTSLKDYLSRATEAAGVALISGIENRIDTNTLGELWRHYLGLRSIYEKTPEDNVLKLGDYNTDYQFGLVSGSSSPDTISFQGASDYMNLSFSQDVLTSLDTSNNL
ncbi:hypothetical protein SWPG_00090 [Synechococcus phage S-CBM2]|nr:hypothetical protein SWPG_00090 [Synechococcus phage S-CBM2]